MGGRAGGIAHPRQTGKNGVLYEWRGRLPRRPLMTANLPLVAPHLSGRGQRAGGSRCIERSRTFTSPIRGARLASNGSSAPMLRNDAAVLRHGASSAERGDVPGGILVAALRAVGRVTGLLIEQDGSLFDCAGACKGPELPGESTGPAPTRGIVLDRAWRPVPVRGRGRARDCLRGRFRRADAPQSPRRRPSARSPLGYQIPFSDPGTGKRKTVERYGIFTRESRGAGCRKTSRKRLLSKPLGTP
jgi:hypothetical protein